ncbi:C-5 cytosine-specific DNA methylase, variant 2 [Cymbomonas tetramitiformis]|uniref:C-5 cytosine-specific DNA methylase, variant 2 n=1 Tax=Cymbomonas tetramitiformis TaxID=36881 RepID=A0AAE0G426_9CHLO|nr:C-5 cytosine-specific DNA methylase, variant 2 [Cymbomonas tetramitiformis]
MADCVKDIAWAPQEPIRALEFYSGIGAMRYALQSVCQNSTVLNSFDINEVANNVYTHNFGDKPVQENLGAMKCARLDKYNANLWLLSPPCQPYTRNGNMKHEEDARSSSFIHLLSLLPSLKVPPTYFFLENVVGFETSNTRNVLVSTLENSGYNYQEYILTPSQFGIPYSRPRYFMLAKRAPQEFTTTHPTGTIVRHPPLSPSSSPSVPIHEGRASSKSEACCMCDGDGHPGEASSVRQVGDFLEDDDRWRIDSAFSVPSATDTDLWQEYAVAPRLVDRNWAVMDVVTSTDRRSNCFTKNYFKFVKGMGSLLAPSDWRSVLSETDSADSTSTSSRNRSSSCSAACGDVHVAPAEVLRAPTATTGSGSLQETDVEAGAVLTSIPAEAVAERPNSDGGLPPPCSLGKRSASEGRESHTSGLQEMPLIHMPGKVSSKQQWGAEAGVLMEPPKQLRYFTEREVANIHQLPSHFEFPSSITRKQRYALLGNSVSVTVVAALLQYLTSEFVDGETMDRE